jgi:DNA-binding transcriptional ArsR family regulator
MTKRLPMDIDLTAARLEALGNPTRLRLYRLLVRAGAPGLAMGRIQERLGIPASTLSHHARVLVSVGLLSQERLGTSLLCRTNYPVMRALIDDLAAECCAEEVCAPGPVPLGAGRPEETP